MKKRHYLFLQGQISRFFCELGRALREDGHVIHRINFNGGDRYFWRQGNSRHFSGGLSDWPGFIEQRIKAWGVTDVILFGDCRPLHRLAIDVAKAQGVEVHVFEEGYLRPDFITLERGGVNGHSSLPRTADALRLAAASLPAMLPAVPIPSSFCRRAIDDIVYNLASLVNKWRFPNYRNHRLWHPFREYAVGVRRLPAKFLRRRQTQRRVESIINGRRPYFLFPLQLESDSQIRFHAPPGGIAAALENVLGSFCRHAPADALLVITEHPLDYGPVDLDAVVTRLTLAYGIADRTVFLRGGSPEALVRAAIGMVTINSTIGISALQWKIPVIALGNAIYGLPGLTHQDGIDSFWTRLEPPQEAMFEVFRRVVMARTQINGGFYSAKGIAQGVAGATRQLGLAAEAGSVRIELRPDTDSIPFVRHDHGDWVPPSPAVLQYSTQT